MENLGIVEIKPFVPSKDFETSKQFYSDLGFECKWSSDDLAYFAVDNSSFMLQKFYVEQHACNFMMHLLVENADAWFERVKNAGLIEKYQISVGDPEDREWGIRDFTLIDPSGVLWRIGNNI